MGTAAGCHTAVMSGSPTHAPVVLDAWFNLQCPDCRTALGDLRALRARYGNRLQVRLRHFPLDRHRYAAAAAQASVEAGRQGDAWGYAEAVLARTEELAELGEELLVEVAKERGLDAVELAAALAEGRHRAVVESDRAEGVALGVTGTPSYGIGGERLDGGRSQEGLRVRIERLADGLLGG